MNTVTGPERWTGQRRWSRVSERVERWGRPDHADERNDNTAWLVCKYMCVPNIQRGLLQSNFGGELGGHRNETRLVMNWSLKVGHGYLGVH